jgi:hypothetical protein
VSVSIERLQAESDAAGQNLRLVLLGAQVLTVSHAGDEHDGELLPAPQSLINLIAGRPVVQAIEYSALKPISGQVQTTNATPTVIFRGPLTSGQGYIATLDIIGVLSVSPFDVCVIRASVAAKRTPTTTALIGTAVQLAKHADANASTWTATGSIAGTDFVVTVTGQANKVINWSLTGSFYQFAPSGF